MLNLIFSSAKTSRDNTSLKQTKAVYLAFRISQTYRNLLNQPNISNEDRNFIKERITNAINFIKNIQQRGDTLTAIGRYILKHQKEFFDGEGSSLTPMTLKEVAEHLERCESTISRAISNKYIDTPQGLYPLKFFFSHNVSRQNHKNVSAHNVKQELAQLIEEENKQSPLSDQDIQAHFNSKGLHLVPADDHQVPSDTAYPRFTFKKIGLFADEKNGNIGKKIMGKGDFTFSIKGAFPFNGDGAFSTKITKVFDAQKT